MSRHGGLTAVELKITAVRADAADTCKCRGGSAKAVSAWRRRHGIRLPFDADSIRIVVGRGSDMVAQVVGATAGECVVIGAGSTGGLTVKWRTAAGPRTV